MDKHILKFRSCESTQQIWGVIIFSLMLCWMWICLECFVCLGDDCYEGCKICQFMSLPGLYAVWRWSSQLCPIFSCDIVSCVVIFMWWSEYFYLHKWVFIQNLQICSVFTNFCHFFMRECLKSGAFKLDGLWLKECIDSKTCTVKPTEIICVIKIWHLLNGSACQYKITQLEMNFCAMM